MWYHLVGISGISMRGIAEILESQGHKVTGSDLKLTGHKKENVDSKVDAVVYTSAVTPGSAGWVEIERANELNIPLIKRGEMLAKIVEDKRLIAVSGTHGKSTTTSMIGLSLIAGGLEPLVIVGEHVSELGGVVYIGTGDWAVIEACEYDRNFLYLKPEIAVITNIEEEHLDHYPGGLPEIVQAFETFVSQVRENGTVVYCGDDETTSKMMEKINVKKISYGLNQNNGIKNLKFDLNIPGDHNRRNALATIAVCKIVGLGEKVVERALKDFRGAKRRFEILGKKNGVLVIDDYGHHPTELKSVIAGAREKFPDKKILLVFWPHQYKRIKPLFDDFVSVLSLADRVILKEIFSPPGRDEILDVSSKDLISEINKTEDKAFFINSDQEIADYINENIDDNWVVITVGIPPIYQAGKLFLESK